MEYLRMGARTVKIFSHLEVLLHGDHEGPTNWLTDHDRISRTQMPMQHSTSVVHLLRIVFDRIQQSLWSRLWAFLLLDELSMRLAQ